MADEAAGADDAGGVPFQEAIDYLRQKVNVPSAKWADIREGAHARAFTVAGATKDGMLVDFRAAIDKAIAEGTSKAEFDKDFDNIVQKYGWDYKGTRGWRTRTIYSTNLTTAYAAGRYAQMTDPDLLRVRPYWRYRHMPHLQHPRPEHEAWDGITLLHNDPWWSTHYGPNGWGCHCWVESVSAGGLKKLGKSGPDKAPPVDMVKATLNTSAGPIEIETPKGIDPGWGYNVGEASQGKKLADDVMQAWNDKGASAWERLTPDEAPKHATLPVDPAPAGLGTSTANANGLRAAIETAIGAPEAAIASPTGDTVTVNAAALADHWAGGTGTDQAERDAVAPMVAATITDPAEVWIAFERHLGSGLVTLRLRCLKRVERKGGALTMAVQAAKGRLEAATFLGADELAGQRVGKLLFSREN